MSGMVLRMLLSRLSIVRCNEPRSTRIGSTMQLEWNLISSSACDCIGSAMPTNSRLPRRNNGSAWCLLIKASLIRSNGMVVGFSAVTSIVGMPNSADAIRVNSALSTRL